MGTKRRCLSAWSSEFGGEQKKKTNPEALEKTCKISSKYVGWVVVFFSSSVCVVV